MSESAALAIPVAELEAPAEADAPLFDVRRFAESDIRFLCNAWVRSAEDSLFARALGGSYKKVQIAIIKRLLLRRGMSVLVACKPDARDVIFGFALYEPECLHYVFVRPEMRGFGIATRLTKYAPRGPVSHPWKEYEWEPMKAW